MNSDPSYERDPVPSTSILERLRSRTSAYIGAAALAFPLATYGSVVALDELNRAGKSDCIEPTVPVQTAPSDTLTALSWNTAGKLRELEPELKQLVAEQRPNVIFIQEGTDRGRESLQRAFPNYYICYVVTDSYRFFDEGGQTNIIMSKQKLKDEDVLVGSIASRLQTTWSLMSGLGMSASTSFFSTLRGNPTINTKPVEAAYPETRISIAATINQQVSATESVPARLVTMHISPKDEENDAQLGQNARWLDKNHKEGRMTISGGDMNEDLSVLRPLMEKIGFSTPLTAPTSRDGKKVLDYFFTPTGTMRSVRVLMHSGVSDHAPLVARIKLTPPPTYE